MKFLTVFQYLFIFICVASAKRSSLVDLDEDNWHEMLQGEWMVEFFAPWCPACKSLQPIWKDFASWSDDLGISVGQVDVTASPGLSGRFMVTALPTIFHIKEGVFRQYRGAREKDEFMSFIEDKKWLELEEVASWKSPASVQMSVVSQFFKLSMTLRGVHTSIVEDYGMPVWASYVMFAVATILIGAMLGLFLVCVIDFAFPARSSPLSMPQITTSAKGSDEEDLMEEKDDIDAKERSEKEEEEEEEDDDDQLSQQQQREEEEESSAADEEEEESSAADEESSSSSPSLRKRRPRKAD